MDNMTGSLLPISNHSSGKVINSTTNQLLGQPIITFELDELNAIFARTDSQYLVGDATTGGTVWSRVAISKGDYKPSTLESTYGDLDQRGILLNYFKIGTGNSGNSNLDVKIGTIQLPLFKVEKESAGRYHYLDNGYCEYDLYLQYRNL
jgi:hypothetical protein